MLTLTIGIIDTVNSVSGLIDRWLKSSNESKLFNLTYSVKVSSTIYIELFISDKLVNMKLG